MMPSVIVPVDRRDIINLAGRNFALHVTAAGTLVWVIATAAIRIGQVHVPLSRQDLAHALVSMVGPVIPDYQTASLIQDHFYIGRIVTLDEPFGRGYIRYVDESRGNRPEWVCYVTDTGIVFMIWDNRGNGRFILYYASEMDLLRMQVSVATAANILRSFVLALPLNVNNPGAIGGPITFGSDISARIIARSGDFSWVLAKTEEGHLVWLVPDPRQDGTLLHQYLRSAEIVTALTDGVITQVAENACNRILSFPVHAPRTPPPFRRRVTTRSLTRRNLRSSKLQIQY